MIGRNDAFVGEDMNAFSDGLRKIVKSSRFLIVGGAGTICQAVTKEIFKRDPKSVMETRKITSLLIKDGQQIVGVVKR